MRPEVFAVEDTSIQVCWDGVGEWAGPVVCRWRDGSVRAEPPATRGPWAVVVDGLPPATSVEVSVGSAHLETLTTLAPPPGRRLSRFATINDVHVGSRAFGTIRPIWNDDPGDPHPLRCARAAVTEAVAWGAEAIVVKGDLTEKGRVAEWQAMGALLAGAGVPVLVIEGNHETKDLSIDGREILGGYGIRLTVGTADHLDLDGVRIVAVPTARWHIAGGLITDRVCHEAARLLGEAPPGAGGVAALHHYPQRFRLPTIYPDGIPGPDARVFLNAVAAANPATIVLTGHSHRHRRHIHGPLAVAEVGSTKDYPGSWAGYTVHDGGIMQTTRRVMEPSAIAWTAMGRRVLGGWWGVWAPGLRSHRCFSYVWPPRSPSVPSVPPDPS